jgi:DNA integrity scanning protein DisA with diadenylate cyclase activity
MNWQFFIYRCFLGNIKIYFMFLSKNIKVFVANDFIRTIKNFVIPNFFSRKFLSHIFKSVLKDMMTPVEY